MHKFINKLMVLFPFEPKYFRGLKTVFVGHPIATDSDFEKPDDLELQNFLISVCKIRDKKNFKIVALLPGSRVSEITNHLPVLEKFTQLMIDRYENTKFIIPTVESLVPEIKKITKYWRQKPVIVLSKSQRVLSYYSSDLAVAASGTVTIELARVGLPFVVIYKTSLVTYYIVRFLIRVRNICLINLLAKKSIIPELLQENCTAESIFQQTEKILNPRESEKQKKWFKKVMEILKEDTKKAAKEITVFINNSRL